MIPESTEKAWQQVQAQIAQRYGVPSPSVEGALFLIGLNELGFCPEGNSRQLKTDLIHLGALVLLARAGYLRCIGRTEDGWPRWEGLENLPSWHPDEEKSLLLQELTRYFAEIWEL
ncbi:MAG: hypothetical protein NZ580_02050 [Bacteroidia bacterium]|nr:hypothetical protein [Bacteroidia bacterium]MDW8235752.1 hypothetical protein [Bacteroidia bacterium]